MRDALVRKTSPAQPDMIDAKQMGAVSSAECEWNDVAFHARHARHESMSANPHMLMHRGPSADHHMVGDLHVTAEQGAIRQDDMIANLTIMGDMRVRQKGAMGSDHCFLHA